MLIAYLYFGVVVFSADETYEKLTQSFLPKKRGAPPHPPAVLCTNWLLQLITLSEEGNKSMKDASNNLLTSAGILSVSPCPMTTESGKWRTWMTLLLVC